MASEVEFGGLIHLSALTTVLTAAYVGIDRLAPKDDSLHDGLSGTTSKALKRIEQLGLKGGTRAEQTDIEVLAKLDRLRILIPVGIICCIAHVRVDFGWTNTFLIFCWRQRHVPMLSYFRAMEGKLHRYIVGLMCVISTMILLGLVAVPLCPEFLGRNLGRGLQTVLYFILASQLLWVFITVGLSWFLHKDRLLATFDRLNARLDQRLSAVREDAERKVEATKKLLANGMLSRAVPYHDEAESRR